MKSQNYVVFLSLVDIAFFFFFLTFPEIYPWKNSEP